MAKQKFKVTNWRGYYKALINRDSVTFWLDNEAGSGNGDVPGKAVVR